MGYLRIEILIENPDEIIANHKGQLIGLASKLLTKEKKHQIVQKKIYEAMKDSLESELTTRLVSEGVTATCKIEIKE